MSEPSEQRMQDEGALARSVDQSHDAIDTSRAALKQDPFNWRLALELKQALKVALHYPDSDPLFRVAARHLPDQEWLHHYTALYAFHGSDLAVLDARGRAMLAGRPDYAPLHALLGDIARQRRDWDGAATAFKAAAALDPAHPDYTLKYQAAYRYQAFARHMAACPVSGEAFQVLVVNLDRNAERWDEIGVQFAGCVAPVQRVAGIEGSRLASSAVQRLTLDAVSPRGTLGCFLSHAAAWQVVVDRSLKQALVVEDDVIPLIDLPARAGPLGLPDGYDVCFVNDRLEPRRDTTTPTPHPLAEIMQEFYPEDNAPGGDGYFVSQAGARRLLDWVKTDGFAADVDWRLLAYGLYPAEVEALPPSHARTHLRELPVARPERLRAYVLHPALIRTVGVSSDREDQNRLAEGRR